MAYDEVLADRIRDVVDVETGMSERRMFGGLAFLVNGNMAVAASGQGAMMLRIDPKDAESLTAREQGPGLEDGAALRDLVQVGLAYARSLPAK